MLSPSAVAIGDCLSIDTTVVEAGGLRWTTVREPLTADFVTATAVANAETAQCISLDAATAAGTLIRCIFRGNARALCTPATTIGVTRLQPTGSSRALATAAATTGTGNKVVAIAMETNATATVVKEVLFDGWGSFGRSQTAT
jgi:hypothetical protein